MRSVTVIMLSVLVYAIGGYNSSHRCFVILQDERAVIVISRSRMCFMVVYLDKSVSNPIFSQAFLNLSDAVCDAVVWRSIKSINCVSDNACELDACGSGVGVMWFWFCGVKIRNTFYTPTSLTAPTIILIELLSSGFFTAVTCKAPLSVLITSFNGIPFSVKRSQERTK